MEEQYLESFLHEGKTYKKIVIYKKIKSINVKLSPEGVFSISAPFGVDKSVVNEFVDSVQEKLVKKHLDKKERSRFELRENGYIFIDDKKYNIFFKFREGRTTSKLCDNYILVSGSISKIYLSVKSLLIRRQLPIWNKMLTELSSVMNVPTPKLKIRHMKSAWGVYHTNDNEIVLNISLMTFSLEIQRYLIVHELAHYFEANHSKYYWDIVELYEPDWKEHRKVLNKYSSY